MEDRFKDSVKVKVDKKTNICHLSIKSSESKVEVFKLPLGEMASLISQFRSQMDSKDSLSGSNIDNEAASNIEE
jgi:hypothetical protein